VYAWHEPDRLIISSRMRETCALGAGAAVLAAAALSGQALRVELSDPPAAIEAGAIWQASVELERGGVPVADARPLVILSDGGAVRLYYPGTAEPDGRYSVKILMPEGRWTYEVRVGKKTYDRGSVHAKPALDPSS